MLRAAAKLVLMVIGLGLTMLLLQESLELFAADEAGLEFHIRQIGLSLFSGIILAVVFSRVILRWLAPSLMVVSGLVALTHALMPASQGQIANLLESWIGISLGVLITTRILKSWTAMYHRHLVAWGGDNIRDEEY